MLQRLREAARALKRELAALAYAVRDARTPWLAKLILLAVLAYAASPIDLIPDFVPVLGYLDDVLLLPLGIWLALRLIPPEVMTDARARAEAARLARQPNYLMAGVIVLLWLAAAWWGAQWAYAWWQAR